MLPPQLREEAGGNVHGHRVRALPAAELEQQALGQGPGPHPRGIQALECVQGLVREGLGNPHGGQAVQVLLGQVPVLVHQLRQILAQGRQGLGKPEAVNLVPEERGQALQAAVLPPGLHGGLLVGEGGPVPDAAVNPPRLAAELLIGPLRRVGLVQQGVFLRLAGEVFQQLLGGHLQDLHGLHQLRGQLQLLAQFGFQLNKAHGSSCGGCPIPLAGARSGRFSGASPEVLFQNLYS